MDNKLIKSLTPSNRTLIFRGEKINPQLQKKT